MTLDKDCNSMTTEKRLTSKLLPLPFPGTLPTEIGLFDKLASLRLERGGLGGKIPSEIGALTDLYFLDIDFNQLTGSLPSELFRLNLTHLDVNMNQLSGDIDGVEDLAKLRFLQVHDNPQLTGTIPNGLGRSTDLRIFTLQGTNITGTVPETVCDLVNAGTLEALIADCGSENANTGGALNCTCCTGCRDN